MTGAPKNLYQVRGGVGAASSVKLINQLLAGVHIVAAAEAMAFAARLGLDTRSVFDILCNATARSWMLESRAPQMLEADWTPHSALAIFVKDLGIVLDAANRLVYQAPISSAAHNLYLTGASHGWSKEADAGIVRLWEHGGISVPGGATRHQLHEPSLVSDTVNSKPSEPESLPAEETIASLPPEYSEDVMGLIQNQVKDEAAPVLVMLDDDPTGTQTCHDINVLTVWET
jgi:hypothetical protein